MIWRSLATQLFLFVFLQQAVARPDAIQVQTIFIAQGTEVQDLPAESHVLLLTNRRFDNASFRLRCRSADRRVRLSGKLHLSAGGKLLGRLPSDDKGGPSPQCAAVGVRFMPPESHQVIRPDGGITIAETRLIQSKDKEFEMVVALSNPAKNRGENRTGIRREGRVLCMLHSGGYFSRFVLSDRVALEPDEKRDVKLKPQFTDRELPVTAVSCDVIRTQHEVKL